MNPELRTLLAARALRALADGYVAVLLPSYLLALGFEALAVGVISTGTLLGSALATLALGAWGHRWSIRRLLPGAALLMAATGIAFGSASGFWPLLIIAFVGTLNPSSGDVSIFLPLEQSRIAALAESEARTRAFANYTIVGALAAAAGALLAGVPAWLTAGGMAGLLGGLTELEAMRAMFWLYGLIGLVVWALYARAVRTGGEAGSGTPDAARSGAHAAATAPRHTPLGASRAIVLRLALLFGIDAFAGGLVLNALLALWLATSFGLDAAAAGAFFFWAGLLTTASLWLAPKLAARVGLVNTMVFTHIPANLCLIAAALAPNLGVALTLLFVRSALSQMDVPTRTAFVMAVVTPPERPAAASFTAVPRSLAAAIGPTLGGALFAAGWLAAPLVLCGALKIGYDLALWIAFRRHERR